MAFLLYIYIYIYIFVTRHAKTRLLSQVDNSILLLIQLEEMKSFKMIPR